MHTKGVFELLSNFSNHNIVIFMTTSTPSALHRGCYSTWIFYDRRK